MSERSPSQHERVMRVIPTLCNKKRQRINLDLCQAMNLNKVNLSCSHRMQPHTTACDTINMEKMERTIL
jgi:hypothetical protein